MRWLFLIAGILCLATGGIHAILWGIDTLNPVMASKVSMEVRAAIMAIWHAITALFALSAIAFFWAFAAERQKARPVGVLLGFFYLIFAGLFAALSFLWFEDPMILPQWTLLAPIGLFALIASV